MASSLAFIIAQTFVLRYLSKTALRSVYGAAGSFIFVLFWLYISGQILMLGADMTRMYTVERGAHAVLAKTWSLPARPIPHRPSVSSLRFADYGEGRMFGPALWLCPGSPGALWMTDGSAVAKTEEL